MKIEKKKNALVDHSFIAITDSLCRGKLSTPFGHPLLHDNPCERDCGHTDNSALQPPPPPRFLVPLVSDSGKYFILPTNYFPFVPIESSSVVMISQYEIRGNNRAIKLTEHRWAGHVTCMQGGLQYI
jgi:hypothetical protein